MPKKKTIAPPATDTEPAEQVIEPERRKPEPEKPVMPIDPLQQKFAEIDANFKQVEQAFQVMNANLQPVYALAEQLKAAQNQPKDATNPNPNGFGGMGQLLPLIMQALSGSGGTDNAFAELAKESMKADIAFTNSLKSAIISKITSGATSEVARAATGEP